MLRAIVGAAGAFFLVLFPVGDWHRFNHSRDGVAAGVFCGLAAALIAFAALWPW